MAKFNDSSVSSETTELQDLDCAIAFIDILKKQGGLSAYPLARSIWLGACYCLAARSIRPANLANTTSRLIEALSPNCSLDKSPLATSVSDYLNELLAEMESKCGPIEPPELEVPFGIEFFHCLLPAWIFQLLSQADNPSTYSQARQSRSFDELPRLTQWFTPQWISTYLAEQSITESTNTFLDPACGGGHLLVEALKKVCHQSKLTPNKALERLWGFDVEPNLLKLSALSLYLCALDLNENKTDPNLSVVNLFYVKAKDSEFGSLLLGLDVDYDLIRYDGENKQAFESPSKFDAIVANPPYLGYRLMPKKMVAFLRANYKNAHFDLYSAFLELATRLISENGTISFICQQSFLNITRYQTLRKKLLSHFKFKSIVTLGAGAFETRSGEKVSSAIVTLRKNNDHNQVRHTDLREPSAKRQAKKSGINLMPFITISDTELYATSEVIAGNPILPDCPPEIAALFSRYDQIDSPESRITVTNGLFTCDNKRFVKHFSQIKDSEKNSYVPYDKGGGHKWFATTPYRLWWKDNGESIRKLRSERGQSKSLPGEDFYFRNGITYSYIGTRGFKARMLSPESVFDIASSSLFCDEDNLHYLLGFLNSSLAIFILGQLNPTVNFQIGDIRRIPYLLPKADLKNNVRDLVLQSIDLAKSFDRINPESPVFDPGLEELDGRPTLERIQAYINKLNIDENILQTKIDDRIFSLYSVSPKIQRHIKENFWVKNSKNFLSNPSPTFLLRYQKRYQI